MLKRLVLAASLLLLPLLTLVPATVQAVDVFPNKVCGGNGKDSTVCKQDEKTDGKNPLFGKGSVLESIINLLSVIVAIAAIIGIILGGLKFISSGNNPQEVSKARETVIYALVALVVAAMAQAIVKFVISNL